MGAKTYQFFDIEWDTDGEKVSLPKKVLLTVGKGFKPENEGADLLSDNYGWFVKGFKFKKLTNIKVKQGEQNGQ